MVSATRTWPALCALLVARMVAARSAHAQFRAAATLRYEREVGVTRCPSDASLQDAVASRLGYDPFHAEAPLIIHVRIVRMAQGLRAHVWRESADAPPSTPRTITSPHSDCVELAGVVALSVAIAIDPMSASGMPPVPSPPTVPAPAPAPDPPPVTTAPPPPIAPTPRPVATHPVGTPVTRVAVLQPAVRLGLAGVAGADPFLTVGFELAAALRWRAWSIAIEARADVPAGFTTASGHEGSAGLFAGGLIPCFHLASFALCPVLQLGVLRGQVRTASPDAQGTFHAAAGARGAFEAHLVGPLSLYVHADLLATLTPTRLQLDNETLWASPPVSGAVGLDAMVHFR